MSRSRLKNGGIEKQNVIDKRKKALKAMAEAKKQKKINLENLAKGNRIVNLEHLGRNLICCNCKDI